MVAHPWSAPRRPLLTLLLAGVALASFGCGQSSPEPAPTPAPAPPAPQAAEPAPAPEPAPTAQAAQETKTVHLDCTCKNGGSCKDPGMTSFSDPPAPGQHLEVIWDATGSEAGTFTITYAGSDQKLKNLVFPATPPPPISFTSGDQGIGQITRARWENAGGPTAVDLRWDYKIEFRSEDGSCVVDPVICVPGRTGGGGGGGGSDPCG